MAPMWVCVDNSSKRPVEGDEIGTLTQATIHALGESRITLRMNNDNGEYLALIDFDDHTFCMQAYERLKNYIGNPSKTLAIWNSKREGYRAFVSH